MARDERRIRQLETEIRNLEKELTDWRRNLATQHKGRSDLERERTYNEREANRARGRAERISDPELRAVHSRDARLADAAATDVARQIVMMDLAIRGTESSISSVENNLKLARRALDNERRR